MIRQLDETQEVVDEFMVKVGEPNTMKVIREMAKEILSLRGGLETIRRDLDLADALIDELKEVSC